MNETHTHPMKKTAVIILNWNGVELLRRFLPGVAETTIDEDTDLYVADNGSTDGSLQWVENNCPQVKTLHFDENLGFAAGYNMAVSRTCYEYTVLLNSDVETTPGWCRALVDFMDANPDCGACQPKILSWRKRDRFEYAGAAGGYLDALGYPYCRGRVFGSVEKDRGQYDASPVDIGWASGAAMMVRTCAYRECGGLDPRFFAHMEEIDLCCRMHAAGWRVCFVAASSVYHVGGASLSKGSARKTYLNFRNNLLLLHKNLPARKARRKTFWRRVTDGIAFGMFVATLRPAHALAVVRAHRDFRRMRAIYDRHPLNDTLSTLPGAKCYILVEHYLKLRRKCPKDVR